jgi:hypothetical protein
MKAFVAVLSVFMVCAVTAELEMRPNGLGVDIIEKPGLERSHTFS